MRSSLRQRASSPTFRGLPTEDQIRRAQLLDQLERNRERWRYERAVQAEQDELTLRHRELGIEFEEWRRRSVHRPRVVREWTKTIRHLLLLGGAGSLVYLCGLAGVTPSDAWEALRSIGG